MSSNASKKRKAGDSSSSGNNKKSNKEDSIAIAGFHTYNLEEIRSKLQLLCDRIPAIPDNQFGLLEIAVPATSAPTENGNSTTKGIGNTNLVEATPRRWTKTSSVNGQHSCKLS